MQSQSPERAVLSSSQGEVCAGGNRRDRGQSAGHPAQDHPGDHESASSHQLGHAAAVPGCHCKTLRHVAHTQGLAVLWKAPVFLAMGRSLTVGNLAPGRN